MAQKTIRIAPLSDSFSQDDIRKALGDLKIIRIHTGKNFAYVELENQQDIQILEFTKPDNSFDQLDGAGFKKVQPTFKWGSISSESSSIQQLKQQHEHFQKMQMSPSSSGQPNPQSLFTVSNCDITIINQLKESQIKSTVFGQFKTIDRVLKKGDKLIIQLLDPVQAQKFEQIFPNLQIAALGKSAFVDLEAQNESNFASQWLEQHHKEEGVKDAQGQKVLHEDIIPKIHKLTSMQDDWIRQQQKQGSGPKTESKYFDIAEHSEQHIKTKSELPGVFILQQEKIPGVFILEPQKNPDSRQQFLIPANNAEEQAARKKQEQEQNKKKLQEINRLKQLEQKRKNQEEKIRRENEERARQIQKEKQEREQREREREQREREREQREREQREREQREKEQHEKERKDKEQKEREHKERQQEQKERKDKELKEIEQREKQQREKQLKEKEQQLKIQKELKQKKEREQKEKELKEREQREKQKNEREQKQKELMEKEKKERERVAKQQQNAQKSRQNLLREGIEKGKKGLENFVTNANAEKISNLIGSEQRTPILFWSLVMIALFILLI